MYMFKMNSKGDFRRFKQRFLIKWHFILLLYLCFLNGLKLGQYTKMYINPNVIFIPNIIILWYKIKLLFNILKCILV